MDGLPSGYQPDSAHDHIDALPSCNIKQEEPRKTSHNFFSFMLLPDDETIIDCRYDIDFIPPIPPIPFGVYWTSDSSFGDA